jgi:hypothetical protein
MAKVEIHTQMIFPLRNIERARPLMKAIIDTVEKIREHRHQHCPNCGGLTPEIIFTYKGYKYSFTCHEIRNQKKRIIAETDYRKLRSYCDSKIRKPKQVDVHSARCGETGEEPNLIMLELAGYRL